MTRLVTLPALALPLALVGACACPEAGRRSATSPAASVSIRSSAPAPTVAAGTPATAVEGAPDAWVAGPGVVVTGQPGDSAWAAYSAAGFRTVVNFRPASEGADRERELVVANGMQYFHLPVVGAGISWGDADALAKILESGSNRNLLLHCSSGNRVAGVWALYQSRYHGLDKDAAIAEGRRVGPMKPAVRKKLEEMLGGK